MFLNEILEEIATTEGAEFFGVADLSAAKEAIREQGGIIVSEYPKSVSIGIILPDAIVDKLPRRQERAVAVSYKNIYDMTNQHLDMISAKLSGLLKDKGYKAFPIPASERYDDENISGIFSHKLAARQAGLGWIGKSCLLISPESGPRVRWATVLTDAPLEVTGEPLPVQCGDCTECVDVCPVDAFTGKPFRENEPREVRYDAHKCERYIGHDDEDELKICGLCIYICPHGRKKKSDH